jgi:predicted thioesterase
MLLHKEISINLQVKYFGMHSKTNVLDTMKNRIRLLLATLVIPIATGLFLTSCLEDKGYTDIVDGINSGNIILSFYGNAGTNGTQSVQLTAGKDTVDYELNISATSSHSVGKDVTVTVSVDETVVAQVNASIENADEKFTLLPDSVYDILSTSVTVPKDTTEASFYVRIYQYKMDKSKSYLLPVKINGVEGVLVADNLGTAKLAFIGNVLAGPYTSTYTLVREGNSPQQLSEDPKALEAVDSKTLKAFAGYAWFGNSNIKFRFSVNSDNTVKITSDPDAVKEGITIGPTSGTTSTYDPQTKTFHLYYEYVNASGLYRRFDEILVKK